jgi:2-polyprenyl-6-methoxyphenol hydroxylase-like FAD-dependent oxidoreductase
MKIVIIGGGITGLTTALTLQKLGFSCQVYEKAPELKAVGAGIWMQPNAMKVLDWIGLGDQVRAAGQPLSRVDLTDRHLLPLKKLDRTHVQDDSYNQIISIHRSRLQKVLYDALPLGSVHLGQAYYRHQIEKASVRIHFEEGQTTADLLLGADGIHSKVRQQLFPKSATRYSGQTCWRGIAPVSLPNERIHHGQEAWGRKVRFGFAPISEQEVYWFAVANAPQGEKDEPGSKKEKLKAMYQDFHPLIGQIIDQTPPEKILRNDISDLKRLPTWYQNRICLLGDAAHATTPNMGQGGGQGVEDAYYISNILAQEKDYRQAFAQFEKERRKKVDYIVNTSWQFGKMAHNPLGQRLFKVMMKWTPERILARQMQKMYAVKEY